MKKIIFIIGGVIFIAIAGRAIWALQQVDNGEEQLLATGNNQLTDENLTKEQKKQLEIVKQMSIDAGLVSDINQIQMSISFYFDKNKILPISLKELYPQFIANKKTVEDERYLYAYPQDRKTLTYHLGIKLEANIENIPALKNDADFNSISANYTNGFNGADPFYDVVLNNDMAQMAERDKVKIGKLMSLVGAVGIYQDSHNGILPSSISFLEQILPQSFLKGYDLLYAISKDKKNYHVGIKLESPDSYNLKTDDDFDSLGTGYTNGFNGKDPIYDKTY